MHWSSFDSNTRPFIHPKDISTIFDRKTILYASYQEYINNISFSSDTHRKLHTGLLPIPFIGDLRNAKIFLLLANPRLDHSDYKAEYDDTDYREAVIQNIKQAPDRNYPFFALNPKFAWTGGFQYWENKFKPLATEICNQKKASYKEILKFISKSIVVLELQPYRSIDSCFIPKLESTEIVKSFLIDTLIPRTEDGSIVLVVMRKVEEWGLRNNIYQNKNIFLYGSYSAHSALLSKGSVAFDAIFTKLYSKLNSM